MYFQTLCDWLWICFKAPTCWVTVVIQLDDCQAKHPLTCSPFPIKLCPTEGWGCFALLSCCYAEMIKRNLIVSENEESRHEIVFVHGHTRLAELKVLTRDIISSEVQSTLLSLLITGRIHFLILLWLRIRESLTHAWSTRVNA